MEVHVVDVGTDGSLYLQVAVDIIDSLCGEAEHVLVRLVAVLVEIPVWVAVILVETVPVGIIAVGGLVVLQPCLIVGVGKSHEVLAHITLRVAKCRTVFNVLAGIVGGEVEVNFSE